jgi:hypothetical protein
MNQIYRGRFYLSVIAFDLWRLIYQNFEQPAQSHMPTAIFLKHNKLKMSKTHFFQMAPCIYYCTGRKLF